MEYVEVHTQAELDKALKKKNVIPVCKGDGYFSVGDSATVEAWDSATVRAWDSATVRAWDSATVRAWGSATVEAWDSATVEAWDSATVRASKYVAVHKPALSKAKVKGGVLIELPEITTAEEWCDFYGVEVKRGVATLYKALNEDFTSGHGMSYAPGTKPEAPDWDGGTNECGGGLHFSPRPSAALKFLSDADRFVSCGVKLSEIVVHKNPMYPNKIKAPRVHRACVECDIDGEPIAKRAAEAEAA